MRLFSTLRLSLFCRSRRILPTREDHAIFPADSSALIAFMILVAAEASYPYFKLTSPAMSSVRAQVPISHSLSFNQSDDKKMSSIQSPGEIPKPESSRVSSDSPSKFQDIPTQSPVSVPVLSSITCLYQESKSSFLSSAQNSPSEKRGDFILSPSPSNAQSEQSRRWSVASSLAHTNNMSPYRLPTPSPFLGSRRQPTPVASGSPSKNAAKRRSCGLEPQKTIAERFLVGLAT